MPFPLSPPEQISIYVHVPFCRRKCDYCHFYILPNRPLLRQRYLDALLAQIEQLGVSEWGYISPTSLVSIYFGGGTPSLLEPIEVQKILSTLLPNLKKRGIFPSADIEITMEVNPEDAICEGGIEKLTELKKLGVNRLSFGVQSFQADELRILSREHTPTQAVEALHIAHKIGFQNISIDLIYDLPDQTIETWSDSLQLVQTLPITHLSLYNLAIEPHTSFYKHRKTLVPRMPQGDQSVAMYALAIEELAKTGLEQYEISAFARNGQKSIHNTGYWLGRNYVGFGPSATSFVAPCRYRNISNLHRYAQLVHLHQPPLEEEERLDPQMLAHEQLILGLRMNRGVNLKDYATAYPGLGSDVGARFDQLIEQNWIEKKEERFCLTFEGKRYFDEIAVALLP